MIAVVMLAIGVAYAVTHGDEGVRRAGWMGEPGRMVVTGCDRLQGSRGGVSYRCYGEFTADDGTTMPWPANMDDTSSSPYRPGKSLRVTSDGHDTVSPVGFGYALDAWAELAVVGVAVSGIGVLLLGTALNRPEGRWFRVWRATWVTGLAMFVGGAGLGILLAIVGLF